MRSYNSGQGFLKKLKYHVSLHRKMPNLFASESNNSQKSLSVSLKNLCTLTAKCIQIPKWNLQTLLADEGQVVVQPAILSVALISQFYGLLLYRQLHIL